MLSQVAEVLVVSVALLGSSASFNNMVPTNSAPRQLVGCVGLTLSASVLIWVFG